VGDRGKMSSFPDPLELEELEGNAEDPSVFDRITAVPGEELKPCRVEVPADDDPISGLHHRATHDEALPSFREPIPNEDDLPPVLQQTTPGSAESFKSTGTRKAPYAKRPVLELEFDDFEPKQPREPSPPDALEAELDAAPAPPADRSRSEPREQAPPAERPLTRASLPLPEPQLPAPAPETVRPSPVSLPRDAGAPALPTQISPQVLDMRDRYATGDFTGALVVAQSLLETEPDHEEARVCHDRCTDVLSQMYLARLGSPVQVVGVAVPSDQIRWLSLDHRAGFLLSLVDGHSTIEELLDISGMPRLDALRILYGLLDQRVIALTGRR
jgi:hypothetical protein